LKKKTGGRFPAMEKTRKSKNLTQFSWDLFEKGPIIQREKWLNLLTLGVLSGETQEIGIGSKH